VDDPLPDPMSEAVWLEISLLVDGELAEPVAEVLARYIPSGVVIESTAVVQDPDSDQGDVIGPLRVFGYLPIDSQLEDTRRHLEESLWYLGRIRPLPAPQFRPVQETDWSQAWKEHYHPIPIGRRLIVVPSWLESPPQDRISIRIDPGMAFGTGTHPTTQLCLGIIEDTFETHPGMEVIDVGCGSGILSIAAVKLGSSHVLGVDIDAAAVRSARKNAETNQVAERLEFGQGSLSDILAGAFSRQQAPLVMANILAPILVRLMDEGLAQLLTTGGNLVLSGIIEEQEQGVIAAAQRNGLMLVERRRINDWLALSVCPQ
jgi:ribosomal protein L11 methyltransferase